MENSKDIKIAYGPVPSRRLGQSLGINNVPPKICSYSCIYCQLGRTLKMQVKREKFFAPEFIADTVKEKVKESKEKNENIDYLAFVPDGEPTLDINLGKTIELLKPLDIDIAVISNASLIWQKDVRENLNRADWVSLKLDARSEKCWKKINRPHIDLKLGEILEGIKKFSGSFKGKFNTETMLIEGVNDNREELNKIADFIRELENVKSYISIPTRPPAEKNVSAADEESVNTAYQIFTRKGIDTEYLIGYEGNSFASTGNPAKDLLSITSVHPMRKEGVREFLIKSGSDWDLIVDLMIRKKLKKVKYEGHTFYIRNFK
ncbi:MAG: radical SAM protein [Elusimicrobiota bacterium]